MKQNIILAALIIACVFLHNITLGQIILPSTNDTSISRGPDFPIEIPDSSEGAVDYTFEFIGNSNGGPLSECPSYEIVAYMATKTVEFGTVGGTTVADRGVAFKFEHGEYHDICTGNANIHNFIGYQKKSFGTYTPNTDGGEFYNSVALYPACDTVTITQSGAGWSFEITRPADPPCAYYWSWCFASGWCCSPPPLFGQLLSCGGWSGYFKLVAHVDQGVTPPTLFALGIAAPANDSAAFAYRSDSTNSGNQSPVVVIVTPSNENSYTPDSTSGTANILIKVLGFDVDGTISQVKVYVGTNELGTATNSGSQSYSLLWNDVPVGTYALTAIATDNGGSNSVSAPVTFQVLGAPVVDGDFAVTTDGPISDLAVQSDGGILIAGLFWSAQGQTRQGVARLHRDGSLDASFDPDTYVMAQLNDGVISAVAVDSLHRTYVGGAHINSGEGEPMWWGGRIVRVDSNGAASCFAGTTNLFIVDLDNMHPTVFGGGGRQISVAGGSSSIMVGGAYGIIGGLTNTGLASILIGNTYGTDGGVDGINQYPGLDTPYYSQVNAVASTYQGFVAAGTVTGEYFSNVRDYGIAWASGLYGSISNFAGGLNSGATAYALAVQADQKVLVGGDFSSAGGIARDYIARFNTNGTLDTSFTASVGSAVNTILVEASGKILVGGAFGLKRLNTNGTTDTNFNVSVNGSVTKLVQQPNGKILTLGDFTTFGGQSHTYIARFTP